MNDLAPAFKAGARVLPNKHWDIIGPLALICVWLAAANFFGIQIVEQVAEELFATRLTFDDFIIKHWAPFAAFLFFQVVLFCVLPVIILTKQGFSVSEGLGLAASGAARGWSILVICLAVLIGYYYAMGYLSAPPVEVLVGVAEGLYVWWSDEMRIILFYSVLIAPTIEEILFRGYIQAALLRRFRALYVIPFVAFVFATFHFYSFQLEDSSSTFLWHMAMGLLLGISRHLSGSIYVPIGLHIVNNVFFVATVQGGL